MIRWTWSSSDEADSREGVAAGGVPSRCRAAVLGVVAPMAPLRCKFSISFGRYKLRRVYLSMLLDCARLLSVAWTKRGQGQAQNSPETLSMPIGTSPWYTVCAREQVEVQDRQVHHAHAMCTVSALNLS